MRTINGHDQFHCLSVPHLQAAVPGCTVQEAAGGRHCSHTALVGFLTGTPLCQLPLLGNGPGPATVVIVASNSVTGCLSLCS